MLGSTTPTKYVGSTIEVPGYPSESIGIGAIYTDSDKVIDTYMLKLLHGVYTSGGQSGAPMLLNSTQSIGIHAGGTSVHAYHSGTRFFPTLLANLQNLIATE